MSFLTPQMYRRAMQGDIDPRIRKALHLREEQYNEAQLQRRRERYGFEPGPSRPDAGGILSRKLGG